MRIIYIHELDGWPHFDWSREQLAAPLAEARFRQGGLLGRLAGLGFDLNRQAEWQTLTSDVLKSSEIEGEHLNPEQVRSSVGRRLGLDVVGLKPADRRTEGTVEMMLDATRGFDQPLTAERLFVWHAALFTGGHSGLHPITVGEWRHASAGAMQVVSGPLGNEHVHFEAPVAERVDGEMRRFLTWFESPSNLDPVLKAGMAHFWFVTIHPFEDGNGRIARAITDMALSRAEGSPQRFYSLSSQTCQERADYYDLLEQSQKASLDITRWLLWFVGCFARAVDSAEDTLASVLAKARFWQRAQAASMNDRQRLIVNRLLNGWQGNLTSSKYAQLAHCSHDTALRDLTALTQTGLLRRGPAGGRSTAYELTGQRLRTGVRIQGLGVSQGSRVAALGIDAAARQRRLHP